MKSAGPLQVEVLAQLCEPPYSFNEKAFRFNTACFGGDRYVCLKDPTGSDKSPPQIAILDLVDDLEVDRRTAKKAEGAMKNPYENLLALRGKKEGSTAQFIQVFNLDSKVRLGEHTFEDEIVFWRWLQNRCLIVVTRINVYHWFVRENADAAETEPILMFARSGKFTEPDVQVINYVVDNETNPSEVQWCLLAGIHLSPVDGKTILGCLQLFSVQKQQQQFLDGYAGCFGTLALDDLTQDPLRVFSFCERKGNVSKLYVMDIYSQRGEGKPAPFKITAEFQNVPEHGSDLPIAQHLSQRHGVIYLITKGGFLMCFDVKTAQRVVCERISRDGIFVCSGCRRTGGVLVLNRKGALISASVNESTIIQHIQSSSSFDGLNVALSLAKRYGYAAADEYLTQMFRQMMQAQRYNVAARIAANSKSGSLRTAATLQLFRAARANAEEVSPIVQYFNALLEMGGRLTSTESLELMKPVVAQGRVELPVKWLQDDVLECTESLGDLVRPMSESMAVTIYARANCHQKVIQYYVEKGQYDAILSYAKKKNYAADYSFLLRSMLNLDPSKAVSFTRALLEKDPPLMDINAAIDVFMQQNRTQEIVGILVDVLRPNRPEQGQLQTRLLEIILLQTSPHSAEAIFQQELFTHYNRLRVAQLCEKAGLYRRALEHYTDMTDIKRVLMRSGNQINLEWFLEFCDQMAPEACIEILTDMLRTNRGNLNSVVQVATKQHTKLGVANLIQMFDNVNSTEGLYYFLGSIMAFSNDPEVHYKYIEAATKLQNLTEVERVVKESKVYDPIKVKDFLKQSELATDPRPLIYLCDIHNFVDELAEYLYRRNLMSYLEVYVTKVNSQAAPTVVATLLDLGCQESVVVELLNKVRGACPSEGLIAEMESRGRLSLILPWMEARIEEGNTETALNNAVAKCYIDLNREPEKFLASNMNYDPLEIGRYCEDKDPHMAVNAYMKGQCDQELINLTTRNGLFRLQAKYLVQRKEPHVWEMALANASQEDRRALVDQVTATALPEATSMEEISVAVKAFVDANIPHELLELLERIVIQKNVVLQSQLSAELAKTSSSMQNLLLLTAMGAAPTKVKDYINRLDAFDAEEVAKVAIHEFNLFEEALLMYQKAKKNESALDVLLTYMRDFPAAETFADKVKDQSVWLILATKELEEAEREDLSEEERSVWIRKSMAFYGKAQKCPEYKRVISVAKRAAEYSRLAEFLRVLRGQRMGCMGDIDSELAYCLAKTQQLPQLETFLTGAHTANAQLVGDRLFEEASALESSGDKRGAEECYKGAKLFFSKVPNHNKLTLCHLKLEDHGAALESAKRAGSAKSWTEVALAAIASKEFKIAHSAGLNVIGHSDHLERLISSYESSGGCIEELITFLEAGVTTGRGNIGLFTEIGVIYAKYRPEKLMDFLKSAPVVTAGRLNVPKLIKVCEAERLYKAEVLLYLSYNEYDQAAQVILNHSATAWEHEQFTAVLQKVTNADLLYRGIVLYLEEFPGLLNQFLTATTMLLDHSRVIQVLKSHRRYQERTSLYRSPVGLIQSWLEEEQRRANESTSVVNETLHDLYLALMDCDSLKKSISTYGNFDQPALATTLEKHQLLEMKQLALFLYEKNGKYTHAIELAKRFRQYSQAMAIARTSGESAVAESLMQFFVEELQSPQLFSACLQVCHSLIRPEVALEAAWTAGYSQEVMPYVIQTVGGLSRRVEKIEREVAEHSQQQNERKGKQANDLGGLMAMPPMIPNGPPSTGPFSPFSSAAVNNNVSL